MFSLERTIATARRNCFLEIQISIGLTEFYDALETEIRVEDIGVKFKIRECELLEYKFDIIDHLCECMLCHLILCWLKENPGAQGTLYAG